LLALALQLEELEHFGQGLALARSQLTVRLDRRCNHQWRNRYRNCYNLYHNLWCSKQQVLHSKELHKGQHSKELRSLVHSSCCYNRNNGDDQNDHDQLRLMVPSRTRP